MSTATTTKPYARPRPFIDFEPANEPGRRVLFTPGPVAVARSVREAAVTDIGAWGEDTYRAAEECRAILMRMCGDHPEFSAVLMPGSGTYGVEAIVGSFVGRGSTLVILSNGLYGERLVGIATALGMDHAVYRQDERTRLDARQVDAFLAQHPEATHVAFCHCETTTGVLNRLDEIGPVVAAHGKRIILDAMATLAGCDIGPGCAIDLDAAPIDHMITSSNKSIQSMPGLCCIISRTSELERPGGGARSMSLDVPAQWTAMRERRRFRFTPPTHVLLALLQALRELEEEGFAARTERYRENQRITVERLAPLGFEPYIEEAHRSHVNTTFGLPKGIGFEALVGALLRRGFVVFPTQVTREPTLRVGSIGAIGACEVHALADAIEDAMRELRSAS